MKPGRTLTVQQLTSSQEGKPVFRATCSYRADVDGGDEYEVALDAGGRSLTRGVMRDRTMRIVATMTQELIVTPS